MLLVSNVAAADESGVTSAGESRSKVADESSIEAEPPLTPPSSDPDQEAVSTAIPAQRRALARVHIESSKQVFLYRRAEGTWRKECSAPCDKEFPVGDTYRVEGHGVTVSKAFQLRAASGGSVELSVSPPSTGGMVVGGVLTGVGSLTSAAGLLVSIVSGVAMILPCEYDCGGPQEDLETLLGYGLLTTGVGVALTVGGLVMLLSSAKTDVAQKAQHVSTAASARLYLRQPAWFDTAHRSAPAEAAAPVTFPLLFDGTF